MKNTDAENQFSPGRAAPFYLAAARAAEGLPQETATGKQHLAALRAAGVREEEIAWLGLNILEVRTGVTKDDVAALIKENAVMVIEEMLTGNDARWGGGEAAAYHAALEEVRNPDNALNETLCELERVENDCRSGGRFHKEFKKISKGEISFEKTGEGGDDIINAYAEWRVEISFGLENAPALRKADIKALRAPAYTGEWTGSAPDMQGGWNTETGPARDIQMSTLTDNGEKTDAGTEPGETVLKLVREGLRLYTHDFRDRYDYEPEAAHLTLPGGENYRELKIMLTGAGIPAETHWNTPDVVAHARMDDRELPDGRRILLIQEIQSDLHQRGRAMGYTKSGQETFQQVAPEFRAWLDSLPGVADMAVTTEEGADPDSPKYGQFSGGAYTDFVMEHDWLRTPEEDRDPEDGSPRDIVPGARARMEYVESLPGAQERIAGFFARMDAAAPVFIPDAPFKKTWHEMVFRRLVREAAECGLDGVAWTPGAMQAGRREQAMAGRRQDGGQFLRTLYDKKLPQYAGDFGKVFGAACSPVQIADGGVNDFHYMPVTPPMREEALTTGFPLFSASMPDARGQI
ncbi:MAG: hypothetical protein ACYYKD_09585 [Rhodospirillales bacterium]